MPTTRFCSMNASQVSSDFVTSMSPRPLQTTRHTRQVLPEQQHTSILTEIISRNYYPALPSLRRDVSILHCRSNGDIAGAVAVRRAARSSAIHEENAQKREELEEDDAVGVRKRPLVREDLEGFHARVTSEGNASFQSSQQKEILNQREKMDTLYSTLSGKPSLRCGVSVETQHLPMNKGWNSTVLRRGTVIAERTPHRTPASSGVNAHPGSSDHNEKSSAMPPPNRVTVKRSRDHALSSVEPVIAPQQETVKIRKQMQTQPLVQITPPKATSETAEKRIQSSQTRFHYQNESRLPSASQMRLGILTPTVSAIPMNKSLQYETDSTDLDATPQPLALARAARAEQLKKKARQAKDATAYNVETGSPFAVHSEITPLRTNGIAFSSRLGQFSGCMDSGFLLDATTEEDGGRYSGGVTMSSFTIADVDTQEQAARLAENKVLERARGYRDAGKGRSERLLKKKKAVLKSKHGMDMVMGSIKKGVSSQQVCARSRTALAAALRSSYTHKSAIASSKKKSSAHHKVV